jgi:hypothetical protein
MKYDKYLTVNEIFFSNTLLSVSFAFPLVLHVFADCVLTVNPIYPVRTESVTGYADGSVPPKSHVPPPANRAGKPFPDCGNCHAYGEWKMEIYGDRRTEPV